MPVANDCTWLVQATVRGETLERLEKACRETGKTLYRINVIPFSEEMPFDMPNVTGPFFFYGYTTLMLNAFRAPRWRQGVFFDPEAFRPSRYLQKWGRDRMLNDDALVLTMEQFADFEHAQPTTQWFVKPNDDLKRFSGTLMTLAEYREWYQSIVALDGSGDVGPQTEIVVCSPKTVGHEWRVFLLDGEIIGSSCCSAGDLDFTLPPELADFARDAAQTWSPAPGFVLDVTRDAEGKGRIVEANCINGSGFYFADTGALVRALSVWQESHWNQDNG